MRKVTLSSVLVFLLGALVIGLLVSPPGPGREDENPAALSRSYPGHGNDLDADNLIRAYPSLVDSRLDHCRTCHLESTTDPPPVANSCDRCHALLLHATGHSAVETLNGFGRDYLEAGRSPEALQAIAGRDSDGDGYSNQEELSRRRFPGSSASRPEQPDAPRLSLRLEELRGIPAHGQFMLVNTTQQRFDEYAHYRGFTVQALLEWIEGSFGVDLSGASGITVMAPDGYMKSLPMDELLRTFPRPTFHGSLGTDALGAECGFVRYPDALPDGVRDGAAVPGEFHVLLAYEKNGTPLDPAVRDVPGGRLAGEGSIRLVVPQTDPGPPDRGSNVSPSGCGDGLDFRTGADHNAGAMVRAVTAIRIDPMPAGVEEPDDPAGRRSMGGVDGDRITIFGYGIR